ncbi:MAG: N-acetyltransferase [Acidimicrobiia bacterium]|nr:N-acetyltransferase [Acidimicrobiia bacterium]
MDLPFVPPDFDVPTHFVGPGFHLEPLDAHHNPRDYEAWTTSMDHITATPGFENWGWPHPMSLEENLADLVGHAADFKNRIGFTYSILDGEAIIGCVYIYPSSTHAASVRSWVRASRADMDRAVWQSLSDWLATEWPFASIDYATRDR